MNPLPCKFICTAYTTKPAQTSDSQNSRRLSQVDLDGFEGFMRATSLALLTPFGPVHFGWPGLGTLFVEHGRACAKRRWSFFMSYHGPVWRKGRDSHHDLAHPPASTTIMSYYQPWSTTINNKYSRTSGHHRPWDRNRLHMGSVVLVPDSYLKIKMFGLKSNCWDYWFVLPSCLSVNQHHIDVTWCYKFHFLNTSLHVCDMNAYVLIYVCTYHMHMIFPGIWMSSIIAISYTCIDIDACFYLERCPLDVLYISILSNNYVNICNRIIYIILYIYLLIYICITLYISISVYICIYIYMCIIVYT